jgi:hypothetical protein
MFQGMFTRRIHSHSRYSRRPKKRRNLAGWPRFAHETLEPRMMLAGTWTQLANAMPTYSAGSMELLTDGTVMVLGGDNHVWQKLTPDANGSYANGTWSLTPNMSTTRHYGASAVLPDGRMMVLGGKYTSPPYTHTDTNTGEIYDPLTNTWTAMANFPEPFFGDSLAKITDDGKILGGYKFGPQTHLYDPATDTWSPGPTKLEDDPSLAQPWVKLRDGDILAYDVLGDPQAQRLDAETNSWIDSGDLPISLRTDTRPIANSDVYPTGPAVLLNDGRVFHLGGNSNTAIYTPATEPGGTGTWQAGPVLSDGVNAWNSSAATLPNGKVLFAAGHDVNAPVHFFEFDPNAPIESSLTDVTPQINLAGSQAWISRMVVLPTGQLLVTVPGANPIGTGYSDRNVFVYTPDGVADASGKPTITSIVASGSNLYTLTGTQLTGITSGASNRAGGSGDTSYPIVQLKNAAGNVYYARSFNWSTSAIATGSMPVTTEFALPEWMPYDTYSLTVVANGIASDPVQFTGGAVKFYVVDDAATNLTYRYAPDGAAGGTSALGTGNTAPRGVASTIAGDKTWVIDANRTVYVYSASGVPLGSWIVGSLAKNATPEGIATDGTDVWIVDSKSDKVYRYAGAASRLSGTQNAAGSFSLNNGNTSPKDIVTNGSSLWVVNDAATDKVFKYSIGGGLQGSWTISGAGSQPTGITIDPANVSDIWIVDNGTDRVYQFVGAATRTSGSQAPVASFVLASGNTNPQGIADPPIATANGSTVDSIGERAALITSVDSVIGETTVGKTTIRPAERGRSAPARRPANFSANVQASENFNLLIGSRPAFKPADSDADDTGTSVASDDTAAVDAAFDTLGDGRWGEIAAEIALAI